CALVDLVYGESTTTLTRAAKKSGLKTVEGLEILVRQGALSLERWTGRPAPIETMRRAARRPNLR
ncbi:MAG: shikimate dehydrogenase, partial [Candidatus Limnocylindria bacterium]